MENICIWTQDSSNTTKLKVYVCGHLTVSNIKYMENVCTRQFEDNQV